MSDTNAQNYKKTLQLPKTSFPMKANLTQREPEILKSWDEKRLYHKMIERNKDKPVFSMPDGPPYANGNLHMGHVLNKVLKDIVIKYRNMSGYKAVFIPGWDCHGLPIEQGVSKELGKKRAEKTDAEIRQLCREYAKKWVNTQREQFIRYGVLGEWENPYLTLQPEYEAEEVRTLAKMVKTGAFHRKQKPVFWCPTLRTALAEAEVDYMDHTSPAIYLKFDVKKDLDKLGNPKKPTAFVIWTTTPWTIPANLALCVHPDFEYSLYDTGKEFLIIADGMKEAFETETGIGLKKEKGFVGKDLAKIRAQHPMYDRDSVVLLGNHVTLEAGTGVVHTAPGHGEDDYRVGLENGLDIYSPVDEAGCYTDEVSDMNGVKVFDANPMVVEKTKASGHLLHHSEITHSYPHNWRSKTPLIFRSTPQWFLGMDLEGSEIRKKALAAIENTKFVPSWGNKRIGSMVENRPDWCLSRQRSWGVPLPIFYCEKCSEPLVSADVMNRVADSMDINGGIEAFHSQPVSEFVDKEKCKECGHSEFTKGIDILDVWFDSGVCWAAVQKKRDGLTHPADLYLEGSDQHRGWFQTSLLASIAAEGVAPFKTILTHGFVNDAKGRKMSKSLGNVVNPQDIIKKNGAEILRLWAAHGDFTQDIGCGNEGFQRLTETYRRFRNTMRFLLGNTSDFDYGKDRVPYEKMRPLDQWALARLNALIEKVTTAYENYEFYHVYHLLNQFATVELSSIYLDVLKDRLYTWKKDGVGRRSAQTALYETLTGFVGLMAPIVSFLAEETLSHIPDRNEESVFLTDFPKTHDEWTNDKLVEEFDALFLIRDEVLKKLEDLRKDKTIGSGLEAKLLVCAEGSQLQALQNHQEALSELFIVSEVEVQEGAYRIEAQKANGEKCVRCWYYDPKTGTDAKHPEVCPKCLEALK